MGKGPTSKILVELESRLAADQIQILAIVGWMPAPSWLLASVCPQAPATQAPPTWLVAPTKPVKESSCKTGISQP
jgi:hypothetical protein